MDFPLLEIFMAMLGFGISIMFCTTFCRACNRLREEQIERESWRRSDQEGRPQSIYVIPFPRTLSQDSEDNMTVPRYSEEILVPPQYNNALFEPPPSYNELDIKLDDLPPAYAEYSVPVYPLHPSPPAAAVVPSEHLSQP